MPADEGTPPVDDQSGLPNRVGWEAVLEVEEQRSRRHGGDHGLVLVQLAGSIDGSLVGRAATAIAATVRDIDFVAVVDRQTFALLALYCENVPALVARLRRAFATAGLTAATMVDARPAGTNLRSTWTAMAADHSLPASVGYVDFVAPARLAQN